MFGVSERRRFSEIGVIGAAETHYTLASGTTVLGQARGGGGKQ